MATLVLKPESPDAAESASRELTRVSQQVYRTRKAPAQPVRVVNLRGGYVEMGVGTDKFPVGTRVFDNTAGSTGVVVGRERERGVFGQQRILVRTREGGDFEQGATPKKLVVLEAPTGARGFSARTEGATEATPERKKPRTFKTRKRSTTRKTTRRKTAARRVTPRRVTLRRAPQPRVRRRRSRGFRSRR